MWFITFFKGLWKYKQIILGAVLVLFFALYANQCNQTKIAKNQLITTQRIADGNLAALKDNTIQLKVTKEQLGLVDSNLKNALTKVDSLGNIKTKVITLTQPVYLGKDVLVPSSLLLDTPTGKYGLKFSSTDVVRTINGTSWFKLNIAPKSITVVPDSTTINDFKLNFALVVSQYDDPVSKYTRTQIVPFTVNSDGSLGEKIPNSMMKINFRNAEILDKPYTLPPSNNDISKKTLLKSGWGVTINPIAFGFYPGNGSMKYGFTPNIGFGYYITLR